MRTVTVNTIAKNLRSANAAGIVWMLTLKLSNLGYLVLDFKSGKDGGAPSMKIDKRFDWQAAGYSTKVSITQVGDKQFGTCEYKGVRLYWDHDPDAPIVEDAIDD